MWIVCGYPIRQINTRNGKEGRFQFGLLLMCTDEEQESKHLCMPVVDLGRNLFYKYRNLLG